MPYIRLKYPAGRQDILKPEAWISNYMVKRKPLRARE